MTTVRTKLQCIQCGNPIPYTPRPDRGNRFCGRPCYDEWRGLLRDGKVPAVRTDREKAADADREREFRQLQAQNRRLLTQIRAADRIVEQAITEMHALPVVRPPKPQPKSKKANEEALLLFTDHHIGAKFSGAEMSGLNFYDIDEYSCRLKYCVTKTIRIIKERTDIHVPKITVFAGGDWVDGLIHDSLERNADATPADQVVIGAYLLAQALLELAASFEQVHVACAPGNHGRLRKPAEFEEVTSNFDTLLYVLARQILSNQKNITWSIPRSFWNRVEVGGQGVLLLHGHVGIRGVSGMATYPGYPLRRSVDNLQHIQRRLGTPARYVCLGHFHSHQCMSHEDGFLIINGSMIGANPYATAASFPHRPALQVLMTMHPKHGMTGMYHLTPEGHGLDRGYTWRRDSFDQLAVA